MPKPDVQIPYLPRRLTRVDEDGNAHEIGDLNLLDRSFPIVVLGEPGMGKTRLLEELASKQSNLELISASKLVRNPSTVQKHNQNNILVIDALDEIAALQEGDPLHNVLRVLGKINYPPFILSCRAADWRGASAQIDIAEDYTRKPEEWTLEPITSNEAVTFLRECKVDQEKAADLIQQLEDKNLAELYVNPLTLSLLVKVISKENYSLPSTRADLFAQATDLLRLEHNPRYTDSKLTQLSKERALDSAGAVMAILLLTGKDATSRQNISELNNNCLPVSEILTLQTDNLAPEILESRLFRSIHNDEKIFVPLHRTIAEYLGARWLAKQVENNSLAKLRLINLMTIDSLVPASMRGLHAWLAHWGGDLAESVILNDPYGLLRYGDADSLEVKHGKKLLLALQRLDEEDAYFRAGDWATVSAKALTHANLTESMRDVIVHQATGYQLRTLLLEIISGKDMALKLCDELLTLLRNSKLSYSERFSAGEVLVNASGCKIDWPKLIRDLCRQSDSSSHRLAVNLIREKEAKNFPEELIGEAVLTYFGMLKGSSQKREDFVSGALYGFAREIPNSSLGKLLDSLSEKVSKNVDKGNWAGRSALSRFCRGLIVRKIDKDIDPLRLWRWLETLKNRDDNEKHKEIASFLHENSTVRQAIQKHVLFSTKYKPRHLARIYGWGGYSSGLEFNPEDILLHLKELVNQHNKTEHNKKVWRNLIISSRTEHGIPEEIRIVATQFSEGDDELTEFLDPRPSPEEVEWKQQEKEWQSKQKKKKIEKEKIIEHQRQDYLSHEAEIRAGDLRWIVPLAKAYLGQFSDIDRDKTPPDRIGSWLGVELQEAALAGFEATLFRTDLPSPDQVASSYAENKTWNYISPIIAGIAERWRNQRGFSDLPIEVFLTGRMGVLGELINDDGCFEEFEEALDTELRNKPSYFDVFIRKWFEPHFLGDHRHITGMYKFVHNINYRPFSTRFSAEWLKKFSSLSFETEYELVQCLAKSPPEERDYAWRELKSIAQFIFESRALKSEKKCLWQSVCFLVDFNNREDWLSSHEVLKPELLWNIRSIINVKRWNDTASLPISPGQLAWVIKSFRSLWPHSGRPSGVTSGDNNSWDATYFLEWAIYELSKETSDEAVEFLVSLIEAPKDSYSSQLQAARAQQRRTRMEVAFESPTLKQISAVLKEQPPSSAGDVQTIALNAISQLQMKILGNSTDIVNRFYYDNGTPRTENDCRDLLIDYLDLPYGIQLSPEDAMPQKKRADVGFQLGAINVPLEAKGQWHKDVWNAASTQLNLYSKDYRADGRGIYLVFWFGRDALPGKRLKRPPNNLESPLTPEHMQTMLVQELPEGLRDSIAVFVLDLSNKVAKK